MPAGAPTDTPTAPPPPGGGGAEDPREAWYRDVIQANPDKYDTGRSKAQWLAWYPLFDAATGQFRSSKRDQSGATFEGLYEHPDACPDGMAAFGSDQCRPTGASAGGPGGYPGGGGPGGTGGGGTGAPSGLDWGTIQSMIGGFSPSLGDDFGMSKYWQSLLGGGKAATEALAPQRSGIVKDTEAAKARILRSVPPGGQRDKMLAQLEASKATAGESARLSLIPQAQAGLSSLYGQQLGARTAQLGQGLGAYTQGKGYDTQYGIASMDDATRRMLGLGQLDLGWGQLGEQGREFDTGLDWDKSKFGSTFGEQKRQFDIGQQDWREQFDYGKKKDTRGFWGSIGGAVGGLLGGGSSKPWWLSDLRSKENVEPYTPGLSEIIKLNPIEYDYKGKEKTHAVSFSAQEVEKVLPAAVATAAVGRVKDMKFIDLARILAATVNAVKELDKRTK